MGRQRFQEESEKAENGLNFKRSRITLNEWFEEWFETYKIATVKEQSVFPMKSKFYNSFGKHLGDKLVTDITNSDVQKVINIMKKEGKADSTMRDALSRMRDCMESAKNNMLIPCNPCFEILVPWENKQAERRFLSRDEQNKFLQLMEHNWYKEMFFSKYELHW